MMADIEAGKRLVQQVRSGLWSRTEAIRIFLAQAFVVAAHTVPDEMKGLEDGRDPHLKGGLFHITQSSDQLQILLAREALEEHRSLRNVSDPLLHIDGALRKRKSVNRHGTRGGRQNPGNDA